MTVLLYVLGVLFFAVGLGVSIGLHEVGHMVPAKKFGGKVTQYFVGFGPTVWSRRIGETEYGVRALPLGGYVKIVGMFPPGKGDDESQVRKSNTGIFSQLISDARAAEYETVEPGDEDRLFYKLTWWKKVVVMAGGPMVNLVIAFLLFGGVFMFHGVQEVSTTVAKVQDCVPSGLVTTACAAGDPESPAKKAGLRAGDHLVAINGHAVSSYDDVSRLIRANGTTPAVVSVERGGSKVDLHVTPVLAELPSATDPKATVKAGYVGFSPELVWAKKGPIYTAGQMVDYTRHTVVALAQMPQKLYHVARAAIGLEQRDPNGPMSVVGAGRVSGEIATAHQATVGDRFASMIALLAGVNLFVGMFNFVPLLPLDGGHIAGALYEAFKRAWAKLRHRPDPGHVDVARMLPVAYTMAGVLLLMSVVLIYADIVAPVGA